MKIIFDNEVEKEEIIKKYTESDSCPSDVWLEDSCAYGWENCEKCWRAALEAVEKREGE